MTKLSNIKPVGRYRHIYTKVEVNVKKGRDMQRGTDHLFYLYRGKRNYIPDMDFYGGQWEFVSL